MTDRSGHVAFFDCNASAVDVETLTETCVQNDFTVGTSHESATDSGNGKLERRLTYENWHPRLTVYSSADLGPEYPDVDVALNQSLEPSAFEDPSGHRQWIDAVFRLVCRLTLHLEPSYVTLYFTSGQYDSVPSERPIATNVETPPGFGVYSPDVLADFGGVDELFDDGPWYVAELTDGRTVVIESASPWTESGWEPPATADYIERAQIGEVDEEDSTIRAHDASSGSVAGKFDPFASLETGEYGADVGVNPDDIKSEFRNEDIQLVRVYVDEDSNLRRVEDDSFVRNVVDEPDDDVELVKGMLADVPTTSTRESQVVSALIHGAIPSSFVRLDDPQSENVVTKVMNLDVDTNKYDLVVSLGRASQHRDEGATETIESALDTLADIEDEEGVEKIIEERLL